MQPPRVFNFTGASSSLAQSLLILSLFAGSLSTVPVAAPAEEPTTDNEASIPGVFAVKKARSFEFATSEQKEMLNRSMGSDAELIDMQNSSVRIADATVDFEDDHASAKSPSETGTATESNAPASMTMSSIPTVVASSMGGTTVEPTLTAPSTAPTPATTTTTNMTEATTTAMTTSVTEAQTDPAEIATVTATTLTRDSGEMPTGVVALVTMIAFLIIAVVAYVSLIVWRRYLEYRYGNRELLVNNLEFDTNDLRHFEL